MQSNNNNNNKILILGAGLSAVHIIKQLHCDPSNYLTVGNRTFQRAASVCNELGDRANVVEVDVEKDQDKLDNLISQNHLVISVVAPTIHHIVAQHCIQNGVPLITASYISPEMRDLDEKAKSSNVTILCELGLDPGISHMAAMRLVHKIQARQGTIRSFEAFTGALPAPQHSRNPFGYKFSWSPIGALLSSQKLSKFLYDGQVVEIPAGNKHFVPRDATDLFPGLNFESIPNRDATQYQHQYGLGNDVSTVVRSSLRYKGYSVMISGLSSLGLLSSEKIPIEVLRQQQQQQESSSDSVSWRQFIKQQISGSSMMNDDLENEIITHIFQFLQKRQDFLLDEINSSFAQRRSNQLLQEEAEFAVQGMKKLGMLSSNKTIDLKPGITYIQATCSFLQDQLVFEEDETDMNVICTRVTADVNGAQEKHFSSMFCFGDTETSATARTVGMPVAAAAELILNGTINRSGVFGPLDASVYEPILDRLREVGIVLKEEYERL